MTSPGSAALEGYVLVVPIGATEQHGPHLPLTTDSDVADALAAQLTDRAPRVVLAPTMPYGASDEHRDFPGTLSIGTDLTTQMLLQLGRSAARSWPRVLFLNAHGGNATALRLATALLRIEGLDVRAWSPQWPGDAHAGHTETSVMLFLRGSDVQFREAAPGAQQPLSALLPRLKTTGVAAVSANGVLGDPTTASAAAGERLLAQAVSQLLEFLADWRREAA
ncbi:MAG: mycofactocin biosynthesis peptidyl-dipeptidase MftE [Solirubrobacteraceae bacterium]